MKRILALMSFLLLVACGEEVVEVSSIALSQPSAELEIGETLSLRATVSPSNATYDGLSWTSTNPKVASVTESGVVSALSEGSTSITVMAGGRTASCSITVRKAPILVASISLNKETLTLVEGETETLVAAVLPEEATDKTVTWTSSNNNVATVKDGVVSAISEGNATITAKAGEKTATCVVSVQKKVVSVESIELNKTELVLLEGDKETLVGTILPEDATDKTVTWKSTNATVASVDGEGTVTAIKEGETTITAEAGGKTASCTVSVQKRVLETDKDSFDVDVDGGTIEVSVSANVEYNVVIEDDAKQWISLGQSSENHLVFSVSDCNVSEDRTGHITLQGKGISCAITVHQFSLKAAEPIVFADKNVKKVCVSYYDANGDGEVSYSEVAGVRSINSSFFGDYINGVTSFDELQYFTSLQRIPSRAFADCKYLKSIVIPKKVQSISENAFSGCNSLGSIVLPDALSSIGKYAFYGCSSLDLDIPESCTSIGEYAFSYSGVTHITIPEGTTVISRCEFMECKKLEYVSLPSSVTKIDDGAFTWCTSLSKANLHEGLTFLGYEAFEGTRISEVQIPSTLVSLSGLCFAATDLTEVVIPSNIVSIQIAAFGSCKNLRKVTIENPDIILDGNPFADNSIEAFYGPLASADNRCIVRGNVLLMLATHGLTRYSVPEGIKTIGPQAATNMTTVERIDFPSTLEVIEANAFYESTSLKSITLPEGLKSLKGGAFHGCTGLSEVTIPDSVTEVGSNAFARCRLTKLVVGKNAEFGENMGYTSFVVDVYTAVMRASVPPKVCPYHIETLYVPVGSKSAYESSAWKSNYTKNVVEYTVE